MANVKEDSESIPEMCPNTEFEEAPADFLYRLAFFFVLLFASYFAMANQLTSLLGTHGFFVLATLNFSFMISCFFGGIAVQKLGKRLIFICGGIAFNIMNMLAATVVSNSDLIWLLYISAVIVGIFGSWLWVAHGAYVAQLYRPSRQGYGFGLFNSLFSINGIVGFSVLLALSSAGLDASIILWIFFGVSLLGTISAFFVKTWRENESDKTYGKSDKVQDEESVGTKVLNVLRMTKDKNMFYQAIFALWAGNTEGMYWTTIAAQYKTSQLIAICFLTQAFTSLIVSFILGIISDKYGRFVAMSFCLIVAMITNIFSGIGVDYIGNQSTRWGLLITGAFGFGCSDFPGQALLRANYQAMYPTDSKKLSDSMAHLLMVLMFGTFTATLIGAVTHPWVSIILNTVIAFLALIGQFLLPKHVNRKLQYT